jgi:hypothetical protein
MTNVVSVGVQSVGMETLCSTCKSEAEPEQLDDLGNWIVTPHIFLRRQGFLFSE